MNKIPKLILTVLVNVAVIIALAIGLSKSQSPKSFVILSTNDIHAQIDRFPALASAIEQCRDSVDVILVDAGDRWTGNAFVDLVEHYTPIYELMNNLNYDVAIYGNHEFDKGQAYVAVANRQASFPIISANIKSDTTTFPQPAAHQVVEIQGKKIAFVGVVGNYDANNHPAGKDESYEGITFSNPHTAAAKYSYLSDECDMLVLVSHSGLDRDIEFAQSQLSEGYDYIISAHSHDTASQTIEGKLISQTGSRLKNIGATTVTISKSGEVTLSHRNVPLSDYEPHESIAQLVEGYYNNPTLTASIGAAAAPFTEEGLINLFTETIRARSSSNIGLYHSGGVRIESLDKGDISLATILNAEPFGSYITTVSMTPSQLRELIMTKFNDTQNVGESHRIDIVTTTPYTILTDDKGEAVDVLFPELDEKRLYKVAMGDYIFKTYRGLNYTHGAITETLITTALEDHITKRSSIEPDNRTLQTIEKSSERVAAE